MRYAGLLPYVLVKSMNATIRMNSASKKILKYKLILIHKDVLLHFDNYMGILPVSKANYHEVYLGEGNIYLITGYNFLPTDMYIM